MTCPESEEDKQIVFEGIKSVFEQEAWSCMKWVRVVWEVFKWNAEWEYSELKHLEDQDTSLYKVPST